MKKVIVVVLVLVSFLLISCSSGVKCNPPYLQVGTSCCLDSDSNSICDNEEKISKEDISFRAFWDGSCSKPIYDNDKSDVPKAEVYFTFLSKEKLHIKCHLEIDNSWAGVEFFADEFVNGGYMGRFDFNEDHLVSACCGEVCQSQLLQKLC